MTVPPPSFATDWTRLWRLAERLAPGAGEEPASVFGPVGLFLGDPTEARAWGYDSTPANATTFASTGGSGVHFSVVDFAGATPVVMTVPMAFDHPNQIVAGDLREFLTLGTPAGFSILERLAYDWGRQDTIAYLESAAAPADDPLLRYLAQEFDLRPPREVAARMTDLESTYRPVLIDPSSRPGR